MPVGGPVVAILAALVCTFVRVLHTGQDLDITSHCKVQRMPVGCCVASRAVLSTFLASGSRSGGWQVLGSVCFPADMEVDYCVIWAAQRCRRYIHIILVDVQLMHCDG